MLKNKAHLKDYSDFAEYYQFSSYRRNECLGVKLIKVLEKDKLKQIIVAALMVDSIEYDLEEFDNYLEAIAFIDKLYIDLRLPLLLD